MDTKSPGSDGWPDAISAADETAENDGFAQAESPRPKHLVPFNQRVMDKVATAFHHACDITDTAVAERLVAIMDRMVADRPLKADGTRRRAVETLVSAHERLWALRFASAEAPQTDGVSVAA